MRRIDVVRSAWHPWPDYEHKGTAYLEVVNAEGKGTGEFITISGVTEEAFKPRAPYIISLPDFN